MATSNNAKAYQCELLGGIIRRVLQSVKESAPSILKFEKRLRRSTQMWISVHAAQRQVTFCAIVRTQTRERRACFKCGQQGHIAVAVITQRKL